MSESFEPKQQTAKAFEDVFDAFKLAFWGDILEDCDLDALPTNPTKGEKRTHCKIRRKTDYDASRNCAVEVTHFMYDSEINSVIEPREHVNIEWDDEDGTNLYINMLDFELGYYESDDEGEAVYIEVSPNYFESAKNMAKTALVAVMTF